MAEDSSEINRLIGELTAEVRGLRRDVQDDRQSSAAYRKEVRAELGEIGERTSRLETDMTAVKATVETVRSVTSEVEKLRTAALGAGTAGRWVIRLCIGAATLAGWILGAWTYWTGRPPP